MMKFLSFLAALLSITAWAQDSAPASNYSVQCRGTGLLQTQEGKISSQDIDLKVLNENNVLLKINSLSVMDIPDDIGVGSETKEAQLISAFANRNGPIEKSFYSSYAWDVEEGNEYKYNVDLLFHYKELPRNTVKIGKEMEWMRLSFSSAKPFTNETVTPGQKVNATITVGTRDSDKILYDIVKCTFK